MGRIYYGISHSEFGVSLAHNNQPLYREGDSGTFCFLGGDRDIGGLSLFFVYVLYRFFD